MDEMKSTLTKWISITSTFAADSSKLYASVRDKNTDVHSEQSPVFEVSRRGRGMLMMSSCDSHYLN